MLKYSSENQYLQIYCKGPMQLHKLDQSVAGEVAFAAEAYHEYHTEGFLPQRIMKGGVRGIILEDKVRRNVCDFTVLALHWMVTAKIIPTKDDFTSQTLDKLLELQRTLLYCHIVIIFTMAFCLKGKAMVMWPPIQVTD